MMAVVSHFFDLEEHHEDRGQTAGARGERGVHRHATDAGVIHDRERRAGVEAVPAEPEDQAADDGDGEIVRKHRPAAVTLELATQPGPKHDGAGDRNPSADRVHDG